MSAVEFYHDGQKHLPRGFPGEFAKVIGEMLEESRRLTEHLPKPIASVYVNIEGRSIEVCLDNSKADYGEWIPGEGADITINRDRETKKVTGAHLPLYAKTLVIGGENFPTITIDLATGQLIPDEDGNSKS